MEDIAAKYPKFVVGSFIFDNDGRLFLRTTPSQGNKFTCINAKVEWGKTINDTLRESVKEKTNLDVDYVEFLSLTDGLNVRSNGSDEGVHMIFADYKVFIKNIADFQNDSAREGRWLKPSEWIALGEEAFGPYIYEVVKRLL